MKKDEKIVQPDSNWKIARRMAEEGVLPGRSAKAIYMKHRRLMVEEVAAEAAKAKYDKFSR
jgi:hypothetical protein